VEFICDHSLEGNEGGSTDKAAAAEEKEGGDENLSKQALKFISYDIDGVEGQEIGTLRLEWRTKHACENVGDGGKSKGWGFFTWLVIMYISPHALSNQDVLTAVGQCVPGGGGVLDLWIMAQLQPLWCKRVRSVQAFCLQPHADVKADGIYSPMATPSVTFRIS
jgi:hypothetical protein